MVTNEKGAISIDDENVDFFILIFFLKEDFAEKKKNAADNINRQQIIKDREQVRSDVIDILKRKSCIVGVECEREKNKFSLHIRDAYINLYKSFDGRHQIILEIVSNVPEVKIIFMPLIDNIEKYKNECESKSFVEGVTFPKSEAIIIAAKGYDKTANYQKFRGTIIHEFCHFAIHEIFGSFKPYYDAESGDRDMWNKLTEDCKINLRDIPIFEDIFKYYEKDKWIDELVVRILEFHVKYEGDSNILSQYEKKNASLSLIKTYMDYVDKKFKLEAEKAASLRFVNRKTLLGNKKTKLHVVDAVSVPVELNCTFSRHVIKTNQPHAIMKNIYKKYHKTDSFMSSFMFVDIEFLDDENFKHVEKALQRKRSTLIIDGHFDFFATIDNQKHLVALFAKENVGKIVLILHEDQNIEFPGEVEVKTINVASILSNTQNLSKATNAQDLYFDSNKMNLNNEAESNRQLKRYDKCFELLEKALKIDSGSDDANIENARSTNIWGCVLYDQSRFLESILKFQEAQRLCRDAMSDQKKTYLNNEAESNRQLKRYDKCFEMLEKALKIDSDSDEANLENARSINFWGVALYDQNKFSESIVKFQEAQWLCTDAMIIQRKMYLNNEAESNRQLKRYDKCFKVLEKALKIDSDSGDVNTENARSFCIWGAVLDDQNKFLESIEKYQDAQRLCLNDMNSQKKNYLNNEAHSHFHLKDYENCFEVLEKALKIDSDSEDANIENARTFCISGNVLYDQSKFSESIVKFQEAQRFCTEVMNDQKKTYLNNEAYSHFDIKDFEKCIKVLKKALKIYSNSDEANNENARSFCIWGNVLYKQNKFLDSIEKYQDAQRLCTDAMNYQKKIYLNNEAYSYFDLKDFEKCIKVLNEALKIDSDSYDAKMENEKSLNLWGCVLFNQGKFAESILKYREAKQISLTNA